MLQCCYLAKGAKRLSHTTNTIKFDRIPFDPCNSIKRFNFCPIDQKNSTYLQPPFGKFELSPFEIKIRSYAFELITVRLHDFFAESGCYRLQRRAIGCVPAINSAMLLLLDVGTPSACLIVLLIVLFRDLRILSAHMGAAYRTFGIKT